MATLVGTTRPRALFTDVGVMLTELDDPTWRMGRQFVQMTNDWYGFPQHRGTLLESDVPHGADPFHVLRVGAVLHALCDDAGLEPPTWVHGPRADPEFMLFGVPMRSRFAARLRQRAHRTCPEHGVWFEARDIRPKKEGLVNPLGDMSLIDWQRLMEARG